MESVRRPGRAATLLFVAFTLLFTTTFAAAPHLVRDINPNIIPVNSNPTDFNDEGSWTFMNAYSGPGPLATHIYATDGTSAGTVRLDSINPMSSGTVGFGTIRIGNLTYWGPYDTVGGLLSTVWVSDGTPMGTHRLKDFSAIGAASPVAAFGNLLIISVRYNGSGLLQYWISDGTEAGTVPFTAVNSPTNINLWDIVVVGSKFYFLELSSSTIVSAWVSDGTMSGTQRLAMPSNLVSDSGNTRLVRAGRYILFYAKSSDAGRELFRIDTNTNAVDRLTDIAPGTASGIPDDAPLASLGDYVLFAASPSGSTLGTQGSLWRSDGTVAGTFPLGSMAPVGTTLLGFSGWVPTFFADRAGTGARAYFVAKDGQNGKQVFISDGSVAGTVKLSTGQGDASLLAAAGTGFYFLTADGHTWRTDGTPGGTTVLANIPLYSDFNIAGDNTVGFIRSRDPAAVAASTHFTIYRHDVASGAVTTLVSYNQAPGSYFPSGWFGYTRGQLLFDGEDPVNGHEPWVSDGTPAGTHLLKNLAADTGSPSSPAQFTSYNGRLYFTATDGTSGRELWSSDGTQDGTRMFIDLNPGAGDSNPVDLFSGGGYLYFFAKQTPTIGLNELWRTDGTLQGTKVLSAIDPPGQTLSGRDCGPPVVIGKTVYFVARDVEGGQELWKSDGSSQGTARVADINPGSQSSTPCFLTVLNGRLFFAADGGMAQGGVGLWTSDGTESGTSLIPGTAGLDPHGLIANNGALYFLSTDYTNGDVVWKTDGTVAATAAFIPSPQPKAYDSISLVALNGQLLFNSSGGTYPLDDQIWAVTATQQTLLNISGQQMDPDSLFSDGTRGYFSVKPNNGGFDTREPWVTDGTNAGTMPLLSVASGFTGVYALRFADFHGVTLFEVNNPPVNNQSGTTSLWKTNGTPAGTVLVADIGYASSSMSRDKHLTVGNNFFYVSDDGSTGEELFAFSNEPPTAVSVNGVAVGAGQSVTINLIANASDSDGTVDPASVTILSQPTGGTVSVSPTGVAAYTANSSFSGADSFTFALADNQGARSQPATVQISVAAAGNGGSQPGGGSGSPGGGSAGSDDPGGKSGGGGPLGVLEIGLLIAAVSVRATTSRRRRRPLPNVL